MYKTGFVFSPDTGEYIGEERVYQEKATGGFPCADNVTFVKPPTREPNTQVVWEGDWVVVDDYRGYPIYDEDGHVVGEVTELGIKPQIITPPPKFKEGSHKFPKWDGVKWTYVIEDGYVETNDEIRQMTQLDKIHAGLEGIPEGMKIENGELVAKTIDDRFDEGSITTSEYNAEIDRMRKARYNKESDPIALQMLRGEATKEEWLAAIEKIKKELPKK